MCQLWGEFFSKIFPKYIRQAAIRNRMLENKEDHIPASQYHPKPNNRSSRNKNINTPNINQALILASVHKSVPNINSETDFPPVWSGTSNHLFQANNRFELLEEGN